MPYQTTSASSHPKIFGFSPERGIISRLRGDFAVEFTNAFNHDHGGQARPAVTLAQPCDVVENRDGSGFDTAVVAINGLGAADLGILQARLLLFVGERLHVVMQRALIA